VLSIGLPPQAGPDRAKGTACHPLSLAQNVSDIEAILDDIGQCLSPIARNRGPPENPGNKSHPRFPFPGPGRAGKLVRPPLQPGKGEPRQLD